MSIENDDTKRLTVQLSKLNVHAQEFVPSAAVFSDSVAGPSGLYRPGPEYFAAGPSPCIGNGAEYVPTSPCLSPPAHAGDAEPSSVKPISEPGPSLETTIQKKRRHHEENVYNKEITIPKKKCTGKKSLKEHVNMVLVGHVDAGKSTIGGQIMSLTGMVDERTLLKYHVEAREKSRESWYLSWALDTNQEERDKGKTVELGRGYFETEKKHFTILDAPGHKSFVPNMIGGAAQADLAVLVVSARKGEFETGFEKGGQTREHAMLVKTAGVKHLVTLVTKMDDPTVKWEQNRYEYCVEKLLPYLKMLGFNPEIDLSFLPVSGQTGQGLLEKVSKDICSWYHGPSFIQLIDELPSISRHVDGPFIMPVGDKYKDMGTILMGKVEAGVTYKGSTLLLMPNKVQVIVDQLWSDDIEVISVASGENVKIKIKGIDDDKVSLGFVLCDIHEPITTGKLFDAQVSIVETKSIITAGYSAVMHIHCAVEPVTVKALICLVDKKTGEKLQTRPRFLKQGQVAIMRIECAGTICMETYKKYNQLSRISLRDENKTIAFGKVLKVVK